MFASLVLVRLYSVNPGMLNINWAFEPAIIDNDDDRSPVWSPDGKKLVYISQRDGATDLYELDVP